jgi:putative ABC transport system permease protein
MFRIALHMLLGDRAKYIMLVSGLTFASLLITQNASIFCGLMLWTTATIRNVNVDVWVADPNVEQVNEVKPLRDTDVGIVRSVPGVEWAIPFYWGLQQARLRDGRFQSIQLVGLDTSTLVGRPARILEGRLDDLRMPNAVIIDELGVKKLGNVKLGDSFEINDQQARIVGICEAARSFLGQPYIYTTYDRALEYAPKQRKMLSFILVKPKSGILPDDLVSRIRKETGLNAFSQEKLFWDTIWWYVKNTGIPIAIGTTVLLGFIVGLAVSGQTFYSFILENLRHLAALKAMGARNRLIAKMILLQCFLVGLIGYGIGVGLASMFGRLVLKVSQPPFFMPYQLLIITFVAIMLICAFSALLGIRRVKKAEPAMVFH